MADLCRQSSENNRRDEISGILVTYADCFLQTLEGPKVAVEDAFLRIMLDSRHHDVMLLSRRTVTKREFGSWDMAHYDRLTPRHEIIERVSRLTQAAPEPMRKAYNDLFTGDTGDSREMH